MKYKVKNHVMHLNTELFLCVCEKVKLYLVADDVRLACKCPYVDSPRNVHFLLVDMQVQVYHIATPPDSMDHASLGTRHPHVNNETKIKCILT